MKKLKIKIIINPKSEAKIGKGHFSFHRVSGVGQTNDQDENCYYFFFNKKPKRPMWVAHY